MEKNKDYYKTVIEKSNIIINTMNLIEEYEPERETEGKWSAVIRRCDTETKFTEILGNEATDEEVNQLRSLTYGILTNRLKHQQADFEAFKQQNGQK